MIHPRQTPHQLLSDAETIQALRDAFFCALCTDMTLEAFQARQGGTGRKGKRVREKA